MSVKWQGEIPTKCQMCGDTNVGKTFVDGRLTHGPWAITCVTCHTKYGVGLGTGRGQLYVNQGTTHDPDFRKFRG